jgi:hypothetical protein
VLFLVTIDLCILQMTKCLLLSAVAIQSDCFELLDFGSFGKHRPDCTTTLGVMDGRMIGQ